MRRKDQLFDVEAFLAGDPDVLDEVANVVKSLDQMGEEVVGASVAVGAEAAS